ncbi:MAG TPA: polysaccharide ABC transporter ATP-binding protein [Flavipsychrobacter sp.]|jgi:lipopolysaccharide transport system ATP-binding protein|nr:polysaccharide ABC transporter ATP-binding protein [Flavipsychrobacter sp.]
MTETALKVENISKRYQIGVYNATSLKYDMEKALRSKIKANAAEQEANHIWALKDVSFEIEKGEVVGIIGKNGSGKSTLLKIISRITKPTTGLIKGNGKISSLLEVGTGFQPELTGRENIYLNGLILGMKKKQIAGVFDEIVAFSGVEKFLDTPVKKYSSGMYVRLAFAVAAHLTSETLIIDEALSVGDAAFQEKCMAKMKDISSQEGKTVIVVSHHLGAVRSMCKRALWLKEGLVVSDGKADEVISTYMKEEKFIYLAQEYHTADSAPGNDLIRIKQTKVESRFEDEHNTISTETPFSIKLSFWNLHQAELSTTIRIHDISGTCVLESCSESFCYSPGIVEGSFEIPGGYLKPGCYYVSFDFITNNIEKTYSFEVCLTFDIREKGQKSYWRENRQGFIRPQAPFILNRFNDPINVAV